MLNSLLQAFAKINANDVGIPKVSASGVLDGVLTTVYFVGGIVCVVVIIIAGILYTVSQGDSSKVAQAKNAILYAVIGLVVIMMAFVITNFIIGRF